MVDQNPYQSPSQPSELLDRFDLDRFDLERLPLVFRIPQSWFLYWSGMLILASVSCVLAVYSLVSFPATTTLLAFIGPLPPAFMIWLCLRSLLSQIEISNAGLRVHKLGRVFHWSDIHSWKNGRYNAPTLMLADGREFSIFGSATSASRNKVIRDALTHFVGNAAPPYAG